jgi:hypothetical protein
MFDIKRNSKRGNTRRKDMKRRKRTMNCLDVLKEKD